MMDAGVVGALGWENLLPPPCRLYVDDPLVRLAGERENGDAVVKGERVR